MEVQKELKGGKAGLLNYVCTLSTETFLNFVDFASIAACFWTILGLLYLCFIKDFMEILVYAAVKYGSRVAWLYKITGVNKIFKNNDNLLLLQTDQKLYVNSRDVTDIHVPVGRFESSPAIIPVTCCSKGQQLLMESPTTPQSSICRFITPRRINVDSVNELSKGDIVQMSPAQQPHAKKGFFSWNFDKIRLGPDSFLRQIFPSVDSEKLRDNIAKKLVTSPSLDKVKLIEDDSPEKIGCCDSVFSFLKNKFQANEFPCSMHYKRF